MLSLLSPSTLQKLICTMSTITDLHTHPMTISWKPSSPQFPSSHAERTTSTHTPLSKLSTDSINTEIFVYFLIISFSLSFFIILFLHFADVTNNGAKRNYYDAVITNGDIFISTDGKSQFTVKAVSTGKSKTYKIKGASQPKCTKWEKQRENVVDWTIYFK